MESLENGDPPLPPQTPVPSSPSPGCPGIFRLCGHEAVATFKKLNGARMGLFGLIDTFSDMGTVGVYVKNGETAWAVISSCLIVINGLVAAYFCAADPERRLTREGDTEEEEEDCLSTAGRALAGALNLMPLYHAYEAWGHSDAEITAARGDEALNSIEFMVFLEAPLQTLNPHPDPNPNLILTPTLTLPSPESPPRQIGVHRGHSAGHSAGLRIAGHVHQSNKDQPKEQL
jgi:hypothetical protein